MAQIELRFFNELKRKDKRAIAELVIPAVAKVHYAFDVVSPGDITLDVPLLNTSLSVSDADFELEISEGSDNWPRDEYGKLLAHDPAKAVLDERAQKISDAILEEKRLRNLSHNIFEVTGIATGWLQYKAE